MRPVAREVLADRQLQAREGAEREADGDHRSALRRADDESGDQHDQADQHHQLDQGKRPPGRGRPLIASSARRRARRLRPGPARAIAWGRRCGASCSSALKSKQIRPHDASDEARTVESDVGETISRCGSKARARGGRRPLANGQPEESLTRHQPMSIPRMPHRGRECHWRQLALADVLSGDPHPAVALRIGDHRLEQASVRLLDLASAAELGLRLRKPHRQRVSNPLQLGDPEHAGPADGAHRPLDPGRGNADANSSPSCLSRAPIWRRRSSRTRRSVELVGPLVR